MSGSNTRGGVRGAKFVCDPEYIGHVQANTPERFNPPAPELGGNPFTDPTTGKPYPGAPG
jgi:hypothetical protein